MTTTIPKNTQRAVDQLAWQTKGRSRVCSNYTEDDVEICKQEITKTITKKSWNTLDKCFKWQFIEKYLAAFPWIVQADLNLVKDKFTQNQLVHIVFNNKSRCVESIGIIIGTNEI